MKDETGKRCSFESECSRERKEWRKKTSGRDVRDGAKVIGDGLRFMLEREERKLVGKTKQSHGRKGRCLKQ